MKKNTQNLSIIDRDLSVEGAIVSTGRLVIKGTVKGAITGEDVIIAEEGVVFSDMKISNLTIGGTFQGDVDAKEELVVLSTGNCSGKVVCKNLVVEGGGRLNAQVFSSVSGEKLTPKPSKIENKSGKEKEKGKIVEI